MAGNNSGYVDEVTFYDGVGRGGTGSGFQVTVDDIKEYFTDGRRVSFIIERRLKWDHPGWTLALSEGAGYDLRDPDGGLWEVRSITRGGVYFNPSAQVGSGRKMRR